MEAKREPSRPEVKTAAGLGLERRDVDEGDDPNMDLCAQPGGARSTPSTITDMTQRTGASAPKPLR